MQRSIPLILLFACLSLPAGLAHAKVDPDKLTVGQTQQLLAIGHKLAGAFELATQGVITYEQAQTAANLYVDQATKVAGTQVGAGDLLVFTKQFDVKPEKAKVLQKYQGVLDGVNLWAVLFVCIGVVALLICLSPLLKQIPAGVYEAGLYVVGGVMIYAAGSANAVRTPFIALAGVLLIAGGLTMTSSMRMKRHFALPSAILAVVSGFTAAHYGSPMISYVTAISLMCAIGFLEFIDPFVAIFGFQDGDELGCATFAAFAIIATYVTMTALGQVNPTLEIFRGGMLFTGCFVGYLGLLIGSTRWYGHKAFGYVASQVIAFALGAAAIFLGPVLGIPELTKIGGTFFVLLVIVKLVEIPFESKTAYAGLVALLCFGGYQGLMLIKEHPETYAPYLLFM